MRSWPNLKKSLKLTCLILNEPITYDFYKFLTNTCATKFLKIIDKYNPCTRAWSIVVQSLWRPNKTSPSVNVYSNTFFEYNFTFYVCMFDIYITIALRAGFNHKMFKVNCSYLYLLHMLIILISSMVTKLWKIFIVHVSGIEVTPTYGLDK